MFWSVSLTKEMSECLSIKEPVLINCTVEVYLSSLTFGNCPETTQKHQFNWFLAPKKFNIQNQQNTVNSNEMLSGQLCNYGFDVSV